MIDIASLVPSIIGLGAKAAGAIPGMKKPKRPQTAKEVAKAAGSHFGKAVGAAQTGRGFSRGLALREGIRGGMDAVEANSRAIGAAAQNDEATYQKLKAQRAENIANFSTDLAKGLGDMAGMAIGPKKGESDLQDPDRPPVDVNPDTGFGTPQDEGDVGNEDLTALEKGMADQEQVEQQQLIDDAAQQLQDFKLKREAAGISAAPKQMDEPTTTSELINQSLTSKPGMSPAIEKELAQTLHLKQLALSEMERTGSNFGEMLPRLNRRLGLSPGQTLQNPFAMDLDVSGEG